MLDDITFGITAFERPRLLENLVASILLRYPMAKIVVADNGRQKAKLPSRVQVLHLPFDCGVSRARNTLIDQLQTKYLLILEEDFLFTDETRLDRMVAILDQDPEVGVVGGAIRGLHGRVSAYSLDIEVFRGKMFVRDASHRLRITADGIPYRLCDVIWNFALFRREMLERHRWADELKVGEHAPYFYQVKLAQQWRVACCPSVALYHVPDQRSPNYLKHRRRAQDLFEKHMESQGIMSYERIIPHEFIDQATDKPCIVILGAGHSGTTVLAKMLGALGWEMGDADEEFGESVAIRELNQHVELKGVLPSAAAKRALERLPQPWVIKDPRFVTTLHHWLSHFASMSEKPVLLRIRRDPDQMLQSYRRRGAPGDVTLRLRQQLELCRQQYESWPWKRLTIDFERIAESVSLFSQERAQKVAIPASNASEQMLQSQHMTSDSQSKWVLAEDVAMPTQSFLDSADPARQEFCDLDHGSHKDFGLRLSSKQERDASA